MEAALAAKAQVWQTGFLAQEVEAAANAVGFDFSGVVVPTAGRAHYGLRYAEFVVPLTQAVQELDIQVHALGADLANLDQRLARLETRLTQPGPVAIQPTVQAQDIEAAEAALMQLEAQATEHKP